MVTRIGSLAVDLRSNAAKFTRGFKRARKAVTDLKNRIPGLNAALTKFSAIAGLVGVGALTLYTKRSLATIDTLGKLSDRLGIQVGELQAWRRAAELGGVGIQQTDKALLDFSKRMGEAKQGLGEGLVVLESLGLRTEEFLNLPLAEQTKRAADAIRDLSSQQEKANAAARLFGESGVVLLNTFEGGSKAIDDSRKQIQDWGAELSRIDVFKVEAANDAVTNLGVAAEAAFSRLTVELAPFIEAAAKELTNFATEGDGFGQKLVDGFEFVVVAVAKLQGALTALRGGWMVASATILEGVNQLVKGFRLLAKGVQNVTRALGVHVISTRLIDDLEAWTKAQEKANVKDFAEGLLLIEKEAPKAEAKARKFFKELRKAADEAAKRQAAAAAARAKARQEGVGGAKTSFGNVPFDFQFKKNPEAELRQNVEKLFAALEDERKSLGLSNDERERMLRLRELNATAAGTETLEIEDLRKQFEAELKQIQLLRKIKDLGDQIGDAFGNAFEDMVFGARSAADAMRELALETAKLVFRQTVTNPLAGAISSGIQGLAGELFGVNPELSQQNQAGRAAQVAAAADRLAQGSSQGLVVAPQVNITTPDVGSFGRSQRQVQEALQRGFR